jgi:hypothetical protein
VSSRKFERFPIQFNRLMAIGGGTGTRPAGGTLELVAGSIVIVLVLPSRDLPLQVTD